MNTLKKVCAHSMFLVKYLDFSDFLPLEPHFCSKVIIPSFELKLSLHNGHISERPRSKLLNFSMPASLAKAAMGAKFQLNIRNYGFASKMRFCRKKSLKFRYFTRNTLWARTHFKVSITHYGLHDA